MTIWRMWSNLTTEPLNSHFCDVSSMADITILQNYWMISFWSSFLKTTELLIINLRSKGLILLRKFIKYFFFVPPDAYQLLQWVPVLPRRVAFTLGLNDVKCFFFICSWIANVLWPSNIIIHHTDWFSGWLTWIIINVRVQTIFIKVRWFPGTYRIIRAKMVIVETRKSFRGVLSPIDFFLNGNDARRLLML